MTDAASCKEMKEALRKSEDRYRLLFNSIDEGFCIIEVILGQDDRPVDFRFLEINPAFERLTGLRDGVGRRMREMVPKLEEFWIDAYDRVARTGEPFRFVYHAALPRNVWFDIHAFRLGGEESNRVAVVLNDITERIRREEALKESEARYRSLFNDNSSVMLLIDPSTGQLVDANQAAIDYYGYSRDKLTSLKITDINTLPLDEVKAEMGRSLAGEKRSFNFRHRMASGEIRDVEVFSGPITVDGRHLLYSIVHDVTGRMQVERMLKESEARYRELFHAMREGVVVQMLIMDDGKVTDWIYEDYNSAYLELIGLTPGTDIRGKKGSEVIGPDLVKEYLPVLERMRSPRAALQLRYTSPLSGRELLASSVAEGDRIVVAFTDITDLKRTEEDLRRSNEELQQFAYVASHDLQEPLRMVTAYLGLLEKKYGGELNPQAKEYMRTAVEGSVRMRELIDDLLQYSRLDSRPVELRKVDMGQVAHRVMENLKITILEAGGHIEIQPLPVVMADEQQITQVLQNLISNAIKFRSDEPPRVEVSAVTYANDFVFSVRDNGIGIDPKYADKLFKMFSRLHARDEYPGTGIGLAIAKKIVERHGGKIWFESEPGKGTTFFFTLPADKGDGRGE